MRSLTVMGGILLVAGLVGCGDRQDTVSPAVAAAEARPSGGVLLDESVGARLCDEAARAELPAGTPFDARYAWKTKTSPSGDQATIERRFDTRDGGADVTATYVCTVDRGPTKVIDLVIRGR